MRQIPIRSFKRRNNQTMPVAPKKAEVPAPPKKGGNGVGSCLRGEEPDVLATQPRLRDAIKFNG